MARTPRARATRPGRSPLAPLADFMARWLREVVVPSLAPTTATNYDLFTRLYVVPDLGRKRLDKLSVRDVQTWLNELRVRCQCCAQGKDAARAEPRCCAAGKCCHQVGSEWTVHQAWTVLRSALSAAMRDELVTRNVAGLVRVPVPRTKKLAIWSVPEARLFLESARRDDDPLYAGYVLMLILGLRRGELLGLAWDDIDLASGEAHIAWQLQRIKGELRRRPTKTLSSEAPLPLPGHLRSSSRLAQGDRGTLSVGGGRGLDGVGPGPHDPVRHADRPSELPTLLPGPGGQGRRPRHTRACNSADVRVAARCPGRPPAGGDDDPAAQQDRRDDGHLQPGVLGLDQGGAQAPRQPVRRGGPVNPVAVLCWSTGMKEALPDERKGPLTWVETRGIEPRTSCLQSRRSTN